jgi:hypothetical protein
MHCAPNLPGAIEEAVAVSVKSQVVLGDGGASAAP